MTLWAEEKAYFKTRYHFTREYVQDGILKIVYISSENDDVDIFTKNTDDKTFWRHVLKFMNYDNVENVDRRKN